MTDHTGRACLEKDELYALAREFERLRTGVVQSYAHSSLPDLATASHQLGALTGLVKDLSDAVLFRAADNDPGLDFGPVIDAYTSASAPAGRAMNNYTEAYEQLGFLCRHAEAPRSANLLDARQSAFDVAQDRLDLTVDSLQETFVTLRRAADRIDGTPPRVLAAVSRSARSANSIYRVPAKPPSTAPTRLAYMPVSRHAR
ncbi:hypothetical protein RFN57_25745 [Streptomyces violaceochromogenes]|uniref:Uncharacterized protein n=1 Tax=Streptomyces violaceochromogenes TaxID=67377 RepID=A0ABU6M2L6_9ACTN|nr:hypothetical protein [Streptomyces violaceochromogenes]MEC7055658.1 hypothetical protein [Streptomyces violaceochromogenes]GHC74359.1 hypothetical protein GCM10010309_45220 [Streptomyces violaceochromogenes]